MKKNRQLLDLTWFCSGGRSLFFLPPLYFSSNGLNKDSVRESTVKSRLPRDVNPNILPAGFLWGAGAEVVLFKAHRMGLHAWSPNVRPCINTKIAF